MTKTDADNSYEFDKGILFDGARVSVYLDNACIVAAEQLGFGDVNVGIRNALLRFIDSQKTRGNGSEVNPG